MVLTRTVRGSWSDTVRSLDPVGPRSQARPVCAGTRGAKSPYSGAPDMAQLLLRALAVPIAVLLCLVPVAVGLSKMYRGMHYFTDVVSGALGGLIRLLVVLAVLWPRPAAEAAVGAVTASV